MDLKKKVTISWSGGKDSAFALFKILQSSEFEVVHLHTVISNETKRVGLHGIRETLIEKQAQALGFKLVKLYLPTTNDHSAYENLMSDFYKQCAKENISAVVFGDIFLVDLKVFRESILSQCGVTGIFPLWLMDSKKLTTDFLITGFKTVVCSANARYFNSDDVGKTIDHKFIDALQPDVDPCGENGEYHTFVFDGPLFGKPIGFSLDYSIEK